MTFQSAVALIWLRHPDAQGCVCAARQDFRATWGLVTNRGRRTPSRSFVLERWRSRSPEVDTDRQAKAFFVPVAEIWANKYDLSINRYKEVAYTETEYDAPAKILDELEALEAEIAADVKTLRGML